MTASNHMNMRNCKLEWSTDNTTWYDASGYSNSVAVEGGEKATEETHVFDSNKPIINAGPDAGITVTARVLYTEGGSEIRAAAQSAYDNNTPFYLRWSPRNAVSGSKMFTTDPGFVKNPLYPQGEKSAAAAILLDLVLHASKINESTVTP